MANILADQVDVTLGRGLSTEQGIQLRNTWPGGKIGFDYKSWLAFYAPRHPNYNEILGKSVRL